MKNKKGILILIISAIVLLVCLTIFVVVGREKEVVVVKENVTVISEGKEEMLPSRMTDTQLIYSENPQFNKGDVLVSGITDIAPDGFLRKVVSVKEENGEYIVETEHAVLTDVFEEVHISRKIKLDENGGTIITDSADDFPIIGSLMSKGVPGYLISKTTDTSGVGDTYLFERKIETELDDYLKLTAQAGVSIWLEFDLDIENDEVQISLTANMELGGEIYLGCEASLEKEFAKQLLEKKLPNIQFYIGVVPIVITNDMNVSVEGKAEINGEVGTSVGIDVSSKAGFQYDSKTNSVKEIKENNYNSDGVEWNTSSSVNGEVKAGAYVHLITKLYGSTGVDFSLGIYASIGGELESTPMSSDSKYSGSIDFEVGPELYGNLVVTVPVIDEKLAEHPIFRTKLPLFIDDHWEFFENDTEDAVEDDDMDEIEVSINFNPEDDLYKANDELLKRICDEHGVKTFTSSDVAKAIIQSRVLGENVSDVDYLRIEYIQRCENEEELGHAHQLVTYAYVKSGNKHYRVDLYPASSVTVSTVNGEEVREEDEYIEVVEAVEIDDAENSGLLAGPDYEGVDWVAFGSFDEDMGSKFISGTGKEYTIIGLEVNWDTGGQKLILKTEIGAKYMITDMPVHKSFMGTGYYEIYYYESSDDYEYFY